MNNQIIPQGARQVITGSSSVITAKLLCFRALTDCAITNLVFIHPAAPHAQVDTAFTLPQGMELNYVESLTLTSGTAECVELGIN